MGKITKTFLDWRRNGGKKEAELLLFPTDCGSNGMVEKEFGGQGRDAKARPFALGDNTFPLPSQKGWRDDAHQSMTESIGG